MDKLDGRSAKLYLPGILNGGIMGFPVRFNPNHFFEVVRCRKKNGPSRGPD
jgi:hypothetical protein